MIRTKRIQHIEHMNAAASCRRRLRVQAGNSVGTVGAPYGCPRRGPARLWLPSPVVTRRRPGSGGVGAFLGVKGSPIRLLPDSPRPSP